MAVYGSSTTSSRRAFRNVSSAAVTFAAGGVSHAVLPGQIITVPVAAADDSTDLVDLQLSGALVVAALYGENAPAEIPPQSSSPIAPVGVSFTAATQSSILGNINGVTIDQSSGYWLLENGNQLLYPNTKLRQQPAAGAASAITIGATMQRASIGGSFGFAIYTDGSASSTSFSNGIVVLYESTGLCNVYQVTNGSWNNITDRTNEGGLNQVAYPMDVLEHTYAAVVQQPDTDTLKITAFCDSSPVCIATKTNGLFFTSGTVGFSTTSNCPPIAIVPNSFEFQLGVDLLENMPVAAQGIIGVDSQGNPVLNVSPRGGVSGVLPQDNTDPAVVAGAVTGTSTNLVPDSGLKFINTLWDTSEAGALSVLPGIGLSGGNGIIYSQPSGNNSAIGSLRYISSAMVVAVTGLQVSLSGNIQEPGALTGGPAAWELWSLESGALSAKLLSAEQSIGSTESRVVAEAYDIPGTVTAVAVVAAANNIAIAGGTSLIFSEPQLEIGPYATAYTQNLLDDTSGTVPYGAMPSPVSSAINQDGEVDVSSPQPGTQLPLDASADQILSSISPTSTGNTFLIGQTVTNQTISPASVAASQTISAIYTDATPNIYNNVSSNYNWYVPGVGPVTVSDTIADGSSLIYSVNIVDPAASPSPVLEQLKIAANSTITVLFQHPAFVATAPGSTRIAFAGTQTTTPSNELESVTMSNGSTPSITTTSSSQTVNTMVSGGISDSGNPSITSHVVTGSSLTAASSPVSDSETVTITGSGSSSTSNQQFTGSASTTSTPSITSTTTGTTVVTAKSQVKSNTSSPTITSSDSSTNQNVQHNNTGSVSSSPTIVPTYVAPTGNSLKGSSVVSISSSPSITQNSTTVYSNNPYSGTATNISSVATITQTANPPTYTTNQHNGGSQSTGTISVTEGLTTVLASGTGPSGSNTISDTRYSHREAIGESPPKFVIVNDGDVHGGGGTTSVGLPSNTIAPTSSGTQFSINITTSGTSSPYGSYVAYLVDPNGDVVQSDTPGDNTTTLFTYSSAIAQSGTYTWKVGTIPDADSWDGEGSPGTTLSSPSLNWSSTTSYYIPQVTSANSSWTTLYTTSSSALAPTSSSLQLSLAISSIVVPADGNGSCSFNIRLLNSSGSVVYTWTNVATATTINWYGSGASAGAYTWQYQAVATAATGAASASSYNCSFAATPGWYQSDLNATTYTYTDTNGSSTSILTSSSALPSSSSTAHTLTISSYSSSASGPGTGDLLVKLYDSNNALVSTWTVTSNSTVTYASSSSAPTGAWTWVIAAGVYSDPNTGGSSITVSCTAQAGWYQSVGSTVYTYSTTNGSSSTVSTSSACLAPSGSTPIAISLSSLVAPSNYAGSSSWTAILTDPSGAVVQTWTGQTASVVLTATSGGGGGTGVYTWTLYGVATSNSTAGSSYTDTANCSPTWYEANTVGSYTYATNNGSSTTISSSSSTVAPTTTATQLSLTLSSVSLGSDSYGASKISVTLQDPTGSQVGSWTVSGSTTLNYSSSGAVAGAYTWTILGVISNNSNTATTTKTYSDTASLTSYWYQYDSVSTTVYTSNAGDSSTYTTTSATLAPASSATQLSFAITAITAGSDSAGTSYYKVVLNNPSGTQAKSWAGINSATTLTYSAVGAASGAWSWVVNAYCTNTGTATSSYGDSLTASLGWYENVTTYTTTYTNNAGGSHSFTTDSTTVAPTSSATQLTYNLSSITAASDSYGSSSWTVSLYNASSTLVKTWTSQTSTSTLSYYNSGASAGTYTWTVQAFCVSNNTGNSTYSDTINGTLGWYQSVTTTTTTYTPSVGTSQSFVSGGSTVAPVSVSSQVSLSLTVVSTPSDSYGSTYYTITVQNPSGTVVGSWSSVTSTGTYTYSNASAVAGIYTWTVYASSSLSGSPGASSYTCSLSGSIGWYESTTTNTTVYQNNNSASITTASSSSATLAPISSSYALSFVPSAITVPSGSAGATQYSVILKSPSGTILQTWSITSATTLTYYNSAAVAGIYTWQFQATCTNTGTSTTTYSTALAGKVVWHENVTGTVLTSTSHDGTSSSYTTPGNTAAPMASGSQISLVLQSVLTPANAYGSSSIAVVLYDPNSTVVAAGTINNITSPTTISYSSGTAISGSYTWVVYGQCSNNDTGASSYAVSWSGYYSWYQPGLTTEQVYILDQDGFTQRVSVSDGNVDFQNITPSTVQFQITNSASTAMTFGLGIISTGF